MERPITLTPIGYVKNQRSGMQDTLVLDIKPVAQEFLPNETVAQPTWMSELMEDYWK